MAHVRAIDVMVFAVSVSLVRRWLGKKPHRLVPYGTNYEGFGGLGHKDGDMEGG